jgi:hypothetical protein
MEDFDLISDNDELNEDVDSNDITVYFRKSGTINDFQEQLFDHMMQVKYEGLILPRQGYLFVLGRQ